MLRFTSHTPRPPLIGWLRLPAQALTASFVIAWLVPRLAFADPAAPRPAGAGLQATEARPAHMNSCACKEILIPGARVVESFAPPSAAIGLPDFLTNRFGTRKFHRRSAWAGRSNRYRPRTQGARVWKSIGEVGYVTVHHAEGVPDEHPAKMIRWIFNGHTASGGRLEAADVGYHFFIDRDGEVWEGRDADKIGTHVGSSPEGRNNEGNLGVCVLGTFNDEAPTRATSRALIALSVALSDYYGRALEVRGHNDWVGIHGFHPRGGVDCPGRLTPAVKKANASIRRAFLQSASGPANRTARSARTP